MKESIGSKIWRIFERFVLFCMNLILKPLGKELAGEKAEAFMQFVKFALVGVTNTVVSYLINAATLLLLGAFGLFPNTDIFIGNTVAFFLSVLWAYMLSNKFVFKEDETAVKRVWWKTLLKTYMAYAFTGLGLSNLISHIGVNILHLNKFIPPLINLVISVPINFILNKFWAYRQDKEPKAAASKKKADVKAIVFLTVSFALFIAFTVPFIFKDPVGSDVQFGLFFRKGQDYLADFFNVCMYSVKRDPYFNMENGLAEKAYLPICYVICFIFVRFMRTEINYPYVTITDILWGSIFVALCVAAIAVATYGAVKGSVWKKGLMALAVCIAGPTLYTMERGNLILIAISMMVIYTATYTSEDKKLRHLGYICLAVAAAIKGYPAILGLLLIYRKQWKEAAFLVLYGAAFAFIPFFMLYNGFSNISRWLENVGLNTEKYEFMSGDKIGYRFFLANNSDLVLDQMKEIRDTVNLIIVIVAILAMLGAFFVKKEWVRYLLLLSIILIFPANNWYYVVMYLIPFAVLLVNEEKNDPFVIAAIALTAVMLTPFRLSGDSFFCETDNVIYIINIAVIFLFAVSSVFCIVSGIIGAVRLVTGKGRVNKGGAAA